MLQLKITGDIDLNQENAMFRSAEITSSVVPATIMHDDQYCRSECMDH